MSAYFGLKSIRKVGRLGRRGVLTVGHIVQVNLCQVSKHGKHTPYTLKKEDPHKTIYNFRWFLIDAILQELPSIGGRIRSTSLEFYIILPVSTCYTLGILTQMALFLIMSKFIF